MKKKGEKSRFVDGSLRLEAADMEELQEAIRKLKIESGELDEGGAAGDGGGDEEGDDGPNPFEEFVPGGFVGRAASTDTEKPEAVARRREKRRRIVSRAKGAAATAFRAGFRRVRRGRMHQRMQQSSQVNCCRT